MKLKPFYLALSLLMAGCQQPSAVEAQEKAITTQKAGPASNLKTTEEAPRCLDLAYYVIKEFKEEQTGKLIKWETSGLFYIDSPEAYPAYLSPCNMPDEVFVEGATVKFKGKLLGFPGMELVNLYARPFELTAFKVVP